MGQHNVIEVNGTTACRGNINDPGRAVLECAQQLACQQKRGQIIDGKTKLMPIPTEGALCVLKISKSDAGIVDQYI
ncbi:hypothetical protein KDC22_24290 [Paenibacillus tritici]|uniref:hypothetical protein n=1 Tax=Paenibacillus tritici TaxID=1873425 RepID=UPI001BAE063D|nr:hypothetical protein [Paenibacillus tritici]QUL53482.1 hypothetical protein KDC22_24290 [Paenibacillus tritici]